MKRGRKRFFLVFVIILIGLFFFRGTIYRSAIKYEDVGNRKIYNITDKNLAHYLDENLPDEKFSDIHIIIKKSQRITSEILSYSPSATATDPNKLYLQQKATCVGYATFAASVANYMMNKMGYDDSWRAIPRKGHLYFLGINVHQYINHRMFKDHDFVIFRNKEGDTEIYIDPTVHDYLWINKVSKHNK